MSPSSASAPTPARWSRSASTSNCSSASAWCMSRGRYGSASSSPSWSSGLCGYLVGKLSFRVRGAYFVIVTISFAEVVRLVALNWVELTQGPLALTKIPPMTLGLPGLGYFDFCSKESNYYLVLGGGGGLLCRHQAAWSNSRIGRAMVALKENESLAVSVGIDVTRYLVLAAVVSAGDRRRRGQPLRALPEDHRSRRLPVPLHRDDGDHGDHRRQGHAGGPDRRRPDLRLHAGGGALVRRARGAVDHLRPVHDPDRVRAAAGHRAGDREMVRRRDQAKARGINPNLRGGRDAARCTDDVDDGRRRQSNQAGAVDRARRGAFRRARRASPT